MTLKELNQIAQDCGFSHMGDLPLDKLELRQEVRDMCLTNSCGQYGKRWSCPPGCGSLDELRAQLGTYHRGILVQTVGQLEDEFDVESMLGTEAAHKENLLRMRQVLGSHYPRLLTIGAGCCTVCARCTYPEQPCRFPERQIVSMEAYGMLVLEVCKQSGMGYYYGEDKIAYTSCFLLE